MKLARTLLVALMLRTAAARAPLAAVTLWASAALPALSAAARPARIALAATSREAPSARIASAALLESAAAFIVLTNGELGHWPRCRFALDARELRADQRTVQPDLFCRLRWPSVASVDRGRWRFRWLGRLLRVGLRFFGVSRSHQHAGW